jgi:glutamine amidotransferase
MIQIIDYGRGNLNNVRKAFIRFGFEADIIDKPDKIDDAWGLVLPGVGAFADSMACLNERGFSNKIREYTSLGKPFLGICLGLQLLFDYSNEFGDHEGLGLLKGGVHRFSIDDKVPHMGWNQVSFKKDSALFKNILNDSYFYFVHSYYALPDNSSVVSATTDYSINFTSAIEADNIYATQFHPVKSQGLGLEIIKNFGEICVHNSGN